MKQTLLTTALLLLSGVATAQHHFSATAGAGPATLVYKLTEGNKTLGFGGYLGGTYHYFFNEQWALGTGLEFALYNAKATLPSTFTDRYMTLDREGDFFEFQTTVTKFEERQNAFVLQIPVRVHFESKTSADSKKPRFFAAAGVKVGVPVTAKYNSKADFTNVGYYGFENYNYDDRFMGFGAFSAEQKDKLDLGVAVLASVELGMRWELQNHQALYAGVYFDYGLNNIRHSAVETHGHASLHTIGYNTLTPTDFTLNPILTSVYVREGIVGTRTFTEKIAPMAVGVTVRFAFGQKKE